MTHSVDMISTGICLNEWGWFGTQEKGRKKMRVCMYVFITTAVIAIKLAAVFLVTNSLLKAYFDPGG